MKLIKITAWSMAVTMLLTGCTIGVEGKLDQAKELYRAKAYNEAIEAYESIIEKDETVYKAWEGLVRSYIREGEFDDAQETLEQFFEAVKAHDGEDEDVDYLEWYDEVADYTQLIIEEGERVGDWYDALKPPVIDIDAIPYNVGTGDTITIEVAEGATLYYSTDGSRITSNSKVYKDGITFGEEGEILLNLEAVNAYNLRERFSIYVSVYEMAEAPKVNIQEGSYDENITLKVVDYNDDNTTVYYTLDGSDPVVGSWYDDYYGIELKNGEYEVRLIAYDYDTGTYSKETTLKYTIDNKNVVSEATELNIGVYGGVDDVYYAVNEVLYDIYLSEDNMDFATMYYYSEDYDLLVEDLKSGELDGVYCDSVMVKELAQDGAIIPVDRYLDMSKYAYFNGADQLGVYEGTNYTLPVTIDPTLILYGDLYDVEEPKVDDWESFIETVSQSDKLYDFLYPSRDGEYWLMSFYLGFGGTLNREGDSVVIDEVVMTKALQFAKDLAKERGESGEGSSHSEVTDKISYNEVSFVLMDTYSMDYVDYYDTYTPIGPMPLPEGQFAKDLNNVFGLHIGPSVDTDNEKVLARVAYKYLVEPENINNIADNQSGFPAVEGTFDEDYYWELEGVMAIKKTIENNITTNDKEPYFELFKASEGQLSEVLDGYITPEVAAKKIAENLLK